MTKRKKYTEEQKQKAIAIYVEHGRKEAEKQTGINGKTIGSWASRAGVATDADEKRRAATEAARAEAMRIGEEITLKLAQRAKWCLDQMDKEFTETVVDQKGFEHEITQRPKPADVKNYATAGAILIDKLHLRTGEPTSIVDSNVKTPDLKALAAQNKKNETVKQGLMAKVLGNG